MRKSVSFVDMGRFFIPQTKEIRRGSIIFQVKRSGFSPSFKRKERNIRSSLRVDRSKFLDRRNKNRTVYYPSKTTRQIWRERREMGVRKVFVPKPAISYYKAKYERERTLRHKNVRRAYKREFSKKREKKKEFLDFKHEEWFDHHLLKKEGKYHPKCDLCKTRDSVSVSAIRKRETKWDRKRRKRSMSMSEKILQKIEERRLRRIKRQKMGRKRKRKGNRFAPKHYFGKVNYSKIKLAVHTPPRSRRYY